MSITYLVAVFFLIAGLTECQLRPLPLKERMKFANHVFTGTVTAIETKDLNRAPHFPDWVTRHFKCTVHVDRVIKTSKHPIKNPVHADDQTVPLGADVHVMLWQGIGRPEEFKGDRGTALLPEVGQSYSFFTQYLHPDPAVRHMYHDSFPHVEEEGMKAYNGLMPNGLAPLEDLVTEEL